MDRSASVLIQQTDSDERHRELVQLIEGAAPERMVGPGLAGVRGACRIKLITAGEHQVMLPLPQRATGQIPICFFIQSEPAAAAKEFHLERREDTNDVVRAVVSGDRQSEVVLEWSAVVLLIDSEQNAVAATADSFDQSSKCAQAAAEEIAGLAQSLWPDDGDVAKFAAKIQEYIAGMEQQSPPRSLDAVGILKSRANWICTANANLAVALMRSKKIPCRSLAVVPPIAARLEMHRIVEYWTGDRWIPFDPSALQSVIPMHPWHSVVMAVSSLEDENRAMTPRMGVSLGCPYGQEAELLSQGVILWGQDFFWTEARPLASFTPTPESIRVASQAWARFLAEGSTSSAAGAAIWATNAIEFEQAYSPQ